MEKKDVAQRKLNEVYTNCLMIYLFFRFIFIWNISNIKISLLISVNKIFYILQFIKKLKFKRFIWKVNSLKIAM